MKKMTLAMIAMLSMFVLLFTACSEDVTTTNVTVEMLTVQDSDIASGSITWKKVSGATSYSVELNEKSKDVTDTSIDLSDYELEIATSYTLRIKPNGVDNSAWKEFNFTTSGEVVVEISQLSTPVIKFNDYDTAIVEWDNVRYAKSYEVYVNDTLATTVGSSTYKYELVSPTVDDKIYIIALGDDISYTDSEKSNELKYILQLETPVVELAENGESLSFEEITNAEGYYVYMGDEVFYLEVGASVVLYGTSKNDDGEIVVDADKLGTQVTATTTTTVTVGDGDEAVVTEIIIDGGFISYSINREMSDGARMYLQAITSDSDYKNSGLSNYIKFKDEKLSSPSLTLVYDADDDTLAIGVQWFGIENASDYTVSFKGTVVTEPVLEYDEKTNVWYYEFPEGDNGGAVVKVMATSDYFTDSDYSKSITLAETEDDDTDADA